MAKQVRIATMPELAMNETDVRVLRLIASRVGRHRKPVEVSQPEIARILGVSMGTARRGIRSLVNSGLIVVSERYLENGCRLENAYQLTPAGKVVLKALAEG